MDFSSEQSFVDYFGKTGVVENITDELGEAAYKEVTHVKENWDCPLRPLEYRGYSLEYLNHECRASTVGALSAGPAILAGGLGTVALGSTQDNDETLAFNQLNFGLPNTAFNLPQFLGELRDFKTMKDLALGSLRPSLRGPLGIPDFKTRRDQWAHAVLELLAPNYRKRGSVRDAVRALVNADLLRKFAVLPFVRDVRNAIKAGRQIAHTWDRLKTPRREELTTYGTVVSTGSRSDAFIDGAVYKHATVREVSVQRRVTAWARFILDTSSIPTPPKWLVGADMLGVDEPLQVIWELTPWTFVVDYFVDIGEWLSQFKGQLVQLPHSVTASGISCKLEETCSASTTFDTGSDRYKFSRITSETAFGSVSRTTYTRRRQAIPLLEVAVPRVHLPSLNQGITIGELALQSLLSR